MPAIHNWTATIESYLAEGRTVSGGSPAKKVDFAKLFADRNALADDTVVKLGDAEVTIGDLRAYDEARGGELAAELKRQQDQLKTDQAKLNAASENVAKLYIELEAARKQLPTGTPATTAVTDPYANYESDQVFGPLVKALRSEQSSHKSALEALTANVDKIAKSVAAMGTTYMGDKAARDFADLMAKDDPVRPKDLSLDSLYRTAMERRILDSNNLPDIKRTYNELTRDARHAHELEQARADERAKVAREAAEGAMLPRPGTGPFGPRPATGEAPKNLNDAFAKASNDRELWQQVSNASSPILGGSFQ